ncbi:unnamed protein product [Durusdinium trenchii]|uniref:Uncharacterized protein n=1 Tax=Durusdinium trenchii TaxID=1381693 RepID=A0ABP0NWG6_9DINO
MGSPLKACLWLYLVRRVAGIAGMTCTSTTPLVWKIQQGQRFAYIAGIYNLPESKAPPLEGGSMAEALSCCDIAYFPTGCSLADKSNVTGVGNYMAHCDYYPVTREKDTIAERLLSTQVVRLKEALQNLSTYAQAECRASANEFLSSVADLNSSTYRITLLTAFRRGMSSINPLWCTDAGTASMETFLRQRWGQRKPIFGLEDVSVECQAFQGNTVAEDQELATFMIDHFNEPWLSQMAKYQENMEQVMKCGDLDVLTTVAEGIKDLPLSSERNLQYRNNNLAWGVQKAMDANQDKNIFFAIPVTHLVDAAGRTGVLSQLTKAGLNPVRQTPAVAAAERCQACQNVLLREELAGMPQMTECLHVRGSRCCGFRPLPQAARAGPTVCATSKDPLSADGRFELPDLSIWPVAATELHSVREAVRADPGEGRRSAIRAYTGSTARRKG